MEFDPKASGWITDTDFICLLIELPVPFGNQELRNHCKFTPKTFPRAKNMVFNPSSYYINEELCILVKNKDILRILKQYKVKTYEGRKSKVHFKDIYKILV